MCLDGRLASLDTCLVQESALYMPEERATAEKEVSDLVKARIRLCQALNNAYHDDSKRYVLVVYE